MTGHIVSPDAGDADLETVGGKGRRSGGWTPYPCRAQMNSVRLWDPTKEAT